MYFTDQENRDPQAATSASDRSSQQANCAEPLPDVARDGRGCVEIQFASNDAINGPLHTNDENLLVCGTPIFGREKNKDGSEAKTDAIEVSGAAPGHQAASGGCADSPTIWSPTRQFTPSSKPLKLPAVQPGAGRRWPRTAAASTPARRSSTSRSTVMDVTNYNATGVATTTLNVPWPRNGVLYVKNNGACTGEIPTDADYDEPVACGNVYVSGTYANPLTIAAANDVIVRPTDRRDVADGRTKDSDIKLATGATPRSA